MAKKLRTLRALMCVNVLMIATVFVFANRARAEKCVSLRSAQKDLISELRGFGKNALLEKNLNEYQLTRVSNLKDSGPGSLRDALVSNTPRWIIFDVNGTIKLNTKRPIVVPSNTVIDGRGRDILIHGGLKIYPGTRNVVITDIAMTLSDEYPSGLSSDLIGIWGKGGRKLSDYTTQNIWLNHLDLSKGTDGAIDIRGGTNITISSCYIHDHEKAILVARDSKGDEASKTHVTMYRNHFKNVTRRQPQMHFGKLDYFNNVIDDWWEFGVGIFEDAEVIVENNFFSRKKSCFLNPCENPNSPTQDRMMRASKLAVTYDWNNYAPGNGRVSGSVSNREVEAESRNETHVFKRKQFYRLSPERMNERLAEKIRKDAGPRGRKKYCIDPKRN